MFTSFIDTPAYSMRAFCSDVSDIERPVLRQFSLQLEIEVLDVWNHVLRVEQIHILRSIIQRDWLQRCGFLRPEADW